MEEIDSVLRNTSNFFLENNKRFFIPEFQRDFVWDGPIVTQLMTDFYEDSNGYTMSNDQLSGYLLGNIVLIKNKESNKYHVVDGQQRSISLSILAKVLYDTLIRISKSVQKNDDEFLKWVQLSANINDIYLIKNEHSESKENRIKINDFLNYGNFYSELIRKSHEEIEELTPQSESENNLLEVYNTFVNEINEMTKEQLENFTYYFKNKVMLIITIAPSEDKAFQLFEVLNDRGKSLEPLDLIKNIFLKQLYSETKDATERRRFNDHWQKFTENLEISRRRTISSSTFLKHYILAMKGKNVRKDKLYTFVKQLNLSKNEILDTAKHLKDVSEIYKDIEEKKYTKFAENSSGKITGSQKEYLKNQQKLLFEVLDVKQFHSLLIPFYFKGYQTKTAVLDSAIKYGASVMFAQRQTNIIESELENILRTFSKKQDLNELLIEINTRKNRFVGEFRATLSNSSIGSRKKKAISLLKFIEIYGNKNIDALHATKTGKNSITLEHILPQTKLGELPKEFENENEYSLYVNYLGNLTILKQADNSSIKNNSFLEKKETYRNSDYMMTNTILKPIQNTKVGGKDFEAINFVNDWNPQYKYVKKNWNKKAINARGKKMTEYVVELLK